MESKIEDSENSPFSYGFSSPIVVTLAIYILFLVSCKLDGRDISADLVSGTFLLPAAAMLSSSLGRLSRTILPINKASYRVFALSTAIFALSIVMNLIDPTRFDNLFISTIVVLGVSSSVLSELDRFEESSVLVATLVGLHLATYFSAGLGIVQGDFTSRELDSERLAIGSSFFSFWYASVALGLFVMISTREALDDIGIGKFLSRIGKISQTKEPMIYSGIIFIASLTPLIWLTRMENLTEFSEQQHLGVVWAIFTTLVILTHAFFRAEGWHVLGALLAANWILYTIARVHELGNELPYPLDNTEIIGSFTWFFIWFWMNFFVVMTASRGKFGDIAPRREISSFRVWWQDSSYFVLVSLAFIVALSVRVAWNVIPAMNASGTGLWDMTGGSDPWYMKRVVDFVIAERSHLIYDHDRAYPLGGVNPRPPLFSWSLALGGLSISWLLEMPSEEAVWWSMSSLPAFYGALIVLPIAGIASRMHGKRAGIISAWLIALMPGHISRSTFAMSDHDSFAMLFLAVAFYFWIRALQGLENRKIFQKTSPNPLYVIAGMRETWRRNPAVMANATMSGIAFTIMALGWKGFVYGPGILFLAYAAQVALNIFRGRDSLEFTSAALQMMLTCTLLPIPFYAWPGMNLLFSPSGMQPMFYIIGFTFGVGWVASSSRDKPWLLVIISGSTLFASILTILYVLQEAEIYQGWDILFTGGFYFSKNKIFNTIGEAQAPSRAILFASYGPIVALIAIGCGFVLLWRGSRQNKSGYTLLGLWAIIATYMAWSAGRFIINATPAMAVVGGIGISMLWDSANFPAFTKAWRNSGIGTPRSRLRSIWPAAMVRPGVPAMLIVLLLVSSQHTTYGIDSGIPRGEQSANKVDLDIYNIAPDILREDFFNIFSVMNSREYNPDSTGLWYMGTFGPSFNSYGWNDAYQWLSEQDSTVSFSERPGFVSWWDYGFQALASGQHPVVADNFQSGIPNSGGMLLSSGAEDTVSLFISTLAQADRKINNQELSDEFISVLSAHMSEDQINEFKQILTNNDRDFVTDRSMAVLVEYNGVELLKGAILADNGVPLEGEMWVVLENGERIGDPTSDQIEAMNLFNETRASSSDFNFDNPQHYDIGGYRYTKDLMVEYYDVSTAIHRSNARLGMMRAFLTSAFGMSELAEIYSGISSISYEVSDYGAPTGETLSRSHEIRYFGVDNRLYPLGGSYYEDMNWHRGDTTGIFYAPTTLSGLDPGTYISTMYQTQRGDGPIIPRTQDQYEQEYLDDVVRQSSGASSDVNEVIRMVDIDYELQPEFFETMIARVYVGYGSSTLGLPGEAHAPSVWFNPQQTNIRGSPGSYLENAFALPGAMMNHFVISNWYGVEECEVNQTGAKISQICGTIYDSNRLVKVLKYYSGATVEGTVQLDGVGPVPNARILIERDAFSGDEVEDENGSIIDSDPRTYWIPIGNTQADENGQFSFTVPAGKIRVSAFSGEPDLESARTSIMSTDVGNSMYELFTEVNEVRDINPVTGVLGNVYGSTWLSETIVNVSGEDGHSNGEAIIDASVSVQPSTYSGMLTWSGQLDFNGDPVLDADVILTPSSEEVAIQPYVSPTSNGTVSGDSLTFSGAGEVTFTGEGSVKTSGVAKVSDFTGTHTQSISNNHSITGEGIFTGKGLIVGSILENQNILSCSGQEIPSENELCSLGNENYLINGSIKASGRFTSDGESQFSRELSQATFVGSGTFETNTTADLQTYGTVNGSGEFSGSGIFSGSMVRPGSFHISGALPGLYDASVDFGDGIVVNLDSTITIGPNSMAEMAPLTISGGSMKGTILDSSGNPSLSPIIIYPLNESVENATNECESTVSPPCFINPDETGSFEAGPIIPGSYLAEIDSDSDGFPEISETLVFAADDDISVEFPSVIPEMYDIMFVLMDWESSETCNCDDPQNLYTDLEVFLSPENESLMPVMAISDNSPENLDGSVIVGGIYRAELSPGIWTLNHTLQTSEGEKQVWQRIEVGPDMTPSPEPEGDDWPDAPTLLAALEQSGHTYFLQISQIVNGSVYHTSNNKQQQVSGIPEQTLGQQEVVFQWGGFKLTTLTDDMGNFSVTLPFGAIVDATVEMAVGIDGFYSNGSRFLVEEGMPLVTIDVTESSLITGSVSLNREGNRYSDEFLGWEPVSIMANNLDGLTETVWRSGVDSQGNFDMIVPQGNWSFVIDSGSFASSTVLQEVNSSISPEIEVLLYPENNVSVLIDFFIDHNRDDNSSNGTLVTYPFQVKPLRPSGTGIEVAMDGDEWYSTGRAEVSLEPGRYRIVVERANSSLNEPFDTLYDVNEIFQVGLDGEQVEKEIGFEPNWLVNITLRNESGELLGNHDIILQDSDSGWIQSFITDENGRMVEYLPEGDWIVIVNEFETSEDVFEGLRTIISSSQEVANEQLNLQTSELATVSVILTEQSDSQSSPSMNLQFTSQEGLGSISATSNGFNEPVQVRLTEGSWNIEMNQTSEEGVRLLIENRTLIEGGVSVNSSFGPDHEVYMEVSTLVQLSGKVFWDLNADDSPSFSEGLVNATVNLTTETPGIPEADSNLSAISGPDGSWSVFLPANSQWNVSVEKQGFEEQNLVVSMAKSSVVEDIKITAGKVQVSGTVSYFDEWTFEDNWEIVLIPAHGISRDRVIPEKIGNEIDGWNGEWSASVEPGRWIVYVSAESPIDGNYLVDVGILQAEVGGGNLDSSLSIGGKLFLDTEWIDYDGTSHTLGEIEGYDLQISLQNGASWSEELGSDGVLEILLPTGRVDSSSEFQIEQRGRNMSYSGGQGVTIRSGQDSPLRSLSLERVSKQDILATAVGESTISATTEEGCLGTKCPFSKPIFTLKIEYEGHNPFDSYDVSGTVPGMDGELWKVEFENETGSWNDTATFEMGLDNVMAIDDFRVRVTPANKSQAHHFPLGHSVLVKFATTQGYSIQLELKVKIPKFSGFELGEEFSETVFYKPDQEQVNIAIPFNNLGNSDEALFFQYEVTPDHWEFAGPENQPISPFSVGSTAVSMNYVATKDVQSDSYVVSIHVSDSINNTYKFDFDLIRDSPRVSIAGETIQLQGGGIPVVGQESIYVIELTNEAQVPANGVMLNATLCIDIKCKTYAGVNSSIVNNIPANGSAVYYLPMDFSDFTTPDKYFIVFEIISDDSDEAPELVACTSEEAEGTTFCVLEAQLWSEAEDDVSGWLSYIFIAMLAAAIYILTKRPGRGKIAPF